MRVLAFMKYDSLAASTRQRLLQYVPYLSAHGIEIDYVSLLGNGHMARVAAGRGPSILGTAGAYVRRLGQLLLRRDYDIIWVQYETFPYLPGLFERLAKLRGKPIVYDFDDAIFHMYDGHASPLVRRLLGDKLEPLLSGASLCICGNAYLRDYALRFCPRSVVVPTVVDTDRYVPARRADGDPVVVGWIGSPSTFAQMKDIFPSIVRLAAERGARIRVIGGGPAAAAMAGIEAADWSEETEIAEIQAMDIGIMPMPDEPWTRGKCGYKLVQYMACGLPVIASPVGVNKEIVADGENGFLAESVGEWADALDRLIASAQLRKAMGAEGRKRAVSDYSLASQAPRLVELLRAVA